MTSINVLGIYNNRTHEGFTSIQNAINDNDTLNGDIITLNDGTYTENVVVNKTVIIRPVDGSLVTVTGSDSSLAVFNITSGGSGYCISGITIIGSEDSYGIFLNNTANCNIARNVISGNDIGIYLYQSNNNTFCVNSLIDNYYGLELYNSTDNIFSENYLTGSTYGIYLEDSNCNNITGNNISDIWNAINFVTSTDNNVLYNNISANWIGTYLYLSNNTVITGNNFEENGVGIAYYDSNNIIFSGNNFTGNWIKDVSKIDSSSMVLATTFYTCGPAALATVMMHMGLNTTEDYLTDLAGTDETGTSIWGLVQAANKAGLTAQGFRLPIDQLKNDYIVLLNINDENHYVIIRNITNTTAYLIDPNLGNIELNLTDFSNAYTGIVLVINNTTEINGIPMNFEEMNSTIGTGWLGTIVNYIKKKGKQVKNYFVGGAKKVYHALKNRYGGSLKKTYNAVLVIYDGYKKAKKKIKTGIKEKIVSTFFPLDTNAAASYKSSARNGLISKWANEIISKFNPRTNDEIGQRVFDYVYNNVVKYWHYHDNTRCNLTKVFQTRSANCAESARIVYNLCKALGVKKGQVYYMHKPGHYWVQILIGPDKWKNIDASRAYANTHGIDKYGEAYQANKGWKESEIY